MTEKLDRYLDNLKEEALKQVIKCLMVGDKKQGMKIIEDQVEEFDKMYSKK